CLQYNVSPFTF
nr:immunoglobulin light chain junction region [Macaca mulatta]